MKLSTKGRYGVKAMLDLALHQSEGQISLKSIAERQNISENYLEQLFATLRKADLVKSIRGSQGGYILSKDVSEISVGQILRALEGSLAPVDCVNEAEQNICCNAERCVTRTVWSKIRDRINEVIDGITLADLMEDYKKMNNKEDYIYYI